MAERVVEHESFLTNNIETIKLVDDDDDDVIPEVIATVPDNSHRPRSVSIGDNDVRLGTPTSRPRSLSLISASSGDVRLSTPTQLRSTSRDGTPNRLGSRPRSRPSSTRYDSALQKHFSADANMPINFHRAQQHDNFPNPAALRRQERDERFQAAAQRAASNVNRVSGSGVGNRGSSLIALGAGSHVGANAPLQGRIEEQRSGSAPALSVKQGPSHRKVRRWNNDRMVGIAAELARVHNNPRCHRAAQEFSRGQAEAIYFLQANHPLNYTSIFASMTDPNCDIKLKVVKERYLAGEVAKEAPNKAYNPKAAIFTDGHRMWNTLVPIRIRSVMEKACESASQMPESPNNVIQILDALEKFVVASSILISPTTLDEELKISCRDEQQRAADLLSEVLIESPGVDPISFSFDAQHPKGGFYRLLAHAVSFFHGMKSTSSDSVKANTRSLTIRGPCHGRQFRLLDYALKQQSV